MATRTKQRRPPKATRARPVQHPKGRGRRGISGWWTVAAALPALAAVLAAVALSQRGGDGSSPVGAGKATGAASLPDTPDYHSLLVAPGDPNALVLGTHAGLYRSDDGGRTWALAELVGRDAMNLAQQDSDVLWTAGHDLLAKSVDGGRTWQDVRPDGLPGLDVHGFAVDPRRSSVLYAAVAGQGLFRSEDGGLRFELVSRGVGPGVMALAVTADGRILAGDMQQGLMVSRDGRSWTQALDAQVMGVAVNPKRPTLVLVSGRGVYRSTDGGRTWEQTLAVADGAGPVAWSTSRPNIGYVVGFDRRLYKTDDAGATWRPV